MRLIQFEDRAGQRRVGVVEGAGIQVLRGVRSTRELGLAAIRAGSGLHDEVLRRGSEPGPDYAGLLEEGRVLPPLDHDDPAHCLVSGTGLTHLGSAATRDRMHQQNQGDETALTDTMRIFRWGLEGGKPPAGQVGAQPEWFYKGDGGIVVRPGADFPLPAFAEDAGEEPELVGLYLIGDDRRPYRLGYALGNEFSDHLMERRNYLYLAHSKLRACCYGPELRVGELPRHLQGESRILRDGEVLWQQAFLSGEDNMCHSWRTSSTTISSTRSSSVRATSTCITSVPPRCPSPTGSRLLRGMSSRSPWPSSARRCAMASPPSRPH
ncbi:GguC protein [Pseudomonas aeruginosa]|nr:GguC protein [Pseudomonas aeruginosa]